MNFGFYNWDYNMKVKDKKVVLEELRPILHKEYKFYYDKLVVEIESAKKRATECLATSGSGGNFLEYIEDCQSKMNILSGWLRLFERVKTLEILDETNKNFAEVYVSCKKDLSNIDLKIARANYKSVHNKKRNIPEEEDFYSHREVIDRLEAQIERACMVIGRLREDIKEANVGEARKKYFLYLLEFCEYGKYVLLEKVDRRGGVYEKALADYLDESFRVEFEKNKGNLDRVEVEFGAENSPKASEIKKYFERKRKRYVLEREKEEERFFRENMGLKDVQGKADEGRGEKKKRLVQGLRNSSDEVEEKRSRGNRAEEDKDDGLVVDKIGNARQMAYNVVEYKYLETLSDINAFFRRVAKESHRKKNKDDEFLKPIVEDARRLGEGLRQKVHNKFCEEIKRACDKDEAKTIVAKYMEELSRFSRKLEKLEEEHKELLRVRRIDREKALKEQMEKARIL